MVEIAVNLNARSVRDMVDRAVRVADAGAARLGVWDSPVAVPECWTTLGVLAGRTTLPLGVTVTNPVTRHPVVTAAALATLAEIAAGGVFLGIGTGDSGVYNLGRRASTLADLRAYVRCVRDLLRTGRHGDLALDRVPDRPVPIIVSAHGLAALETAAEIGDAVIVGLGFSADVVAAVTEVVHRVADRTGRDPVPLWWNTGSFSVDDDPDRARAAGGWLLAAHAHHFARSGLATKAVPVEYRDPIAALGASYDLSAHGRQPEDAKRRYVDTAIGLGVWDYLCDRFLVAGTPAQVHDRIEALGERGVTRLETSTSVRGVDDLVPILNLFQSTLKLS
ncbi:LLM class flavin-dependent oxidoreductase [Saccharothrix violaceirubra]|uniref:5,10-methylenetetrahydromethanopterin reductase n=1 Tax=Saccharothrix violaceirubra TaxID=413306 RepID=A0A7W7T3G5_9PSEU|nr:LLM class flavin-dependent oxidoreductase [Saccharothrix violaceirubra]MBB4965811.1 5,10-methylenetetrahydromethanopterin reductase [Saccharothrix violaceirubra]